MGAMPVTRLETLADGVFAIAVTLLVLEIVVPEAVDAELAARLADPWPRILIYAISFVVLGVYGSATTTSSVSFGARI